VPVVLRPARPRLRPRRPARADQPRVDRGWPRLAVALRGAAAGGRTGKPGARSGLHPAPPRAAPRTRSGRQRALAEARHREPHPLLQGSRRRRRGGQSRGARPDHALVLLDREPRERGRRTRSGRRDARCGLLPCRTRSGEADRDLRLRRDALCGRGQLRHGEPADGGTVVRARLGIRQRAASLLLRRGIQDDLVRDRRAARLAHPDRGRSSTRASTS
jgi:hypothetical protein